MMRGCRDRLAPCQVGIVLATLGRGNVVAVHRCLRLWVLILWVLIL